MEEKPHYHVVFATPGEHMTAAYVESLVQTCAWLDEEKMTYTFINGYSSFVPSAREMTATGTPSQNWETKELGSGKFTYDRVFWIDSDISWDIEQFETLLDSEKDIISGLYRVGGAGRVAVTRFVDGKPTVVNELDLTLETGEIEVDGVGFGFVAMNRGVFEAIPRPWFEIRQVEVDGADFPVNLSEDYSFCRKAQEAGFQIWVNPEALVRHQKTVLF